MGSCLRVVDAQKDASTEKLQRRVDYHPPLRVLRRLWTNGTGAQSLVDEGIQGCVRSKIVRMCETESDPVAGDPRLLSHEQRLAALIALLARAPQQSIAQFAVTVRRAVLALDPRSRDDRVTDALAQRRVVFTAQPDGITELCAPLPAPHAAAIQARIQTLADAWNGRDERSADQRRADALIALLLDNSATADPDTSGRPALKPAVNVVVALSTLLALDNQPGELDGHGPIPAALARALAFDPTGSWRRLVTDECNQLIDICATTYRPPAPMARFVTTKQRTCSFPSCRRRAVTCEIDHLIPWCEGGPTCPANLQPLCTRHHHAKHEAGWQPKKQPDGTTTWTSPSGHTYPRPPDDLPIDNTAKIDEPPPF
jgi:Domain of unknown function (DUF222)/HNH endonuclease